MLNPHKKAAEKAFCKTHGDYLISYLNISNSGPTFLCSECIELGNFDYLLIEDIQMSKDHIVFNKLLFEEKEVISELKQQLKPIPDIQFSFEQRTITFLNELDKTIRIKQISFKEKLISIAKNVDSHKNRLRETYNKGCQKQKLKELLSDTSSRIYENEGYIKEVVKQIRDNTEAQKQIKEMIKEHEIQKKTLEQNLISELYNQELKEYIEQQQFIY